MIDGWSDVDVHFPPFLFHLPERTPAEQTERCNDTKSSYDGGCGKWYASQEPVNNSYEKYGEECCNGGEDWRGKRDEYEERAREC